MKHQTTSIEHGKRNDENFFFNLPLRFLKLRYRISRSFMRLGMMMLLKVKQLPQADIKPTYGINQFVKAEFDGTRYPSGGIF